MGERHQKLNLLGTAATERKLNRRVALTGVLNDARDGILLVRWQDQSLALGEFPIVVFPEAVFSEFAPEIDALVVLIDHGLDDYVKKKIQIATDQKLEVVFRACELDVKEKLIKESDS